MLRTVGPYQRRGRRPLEERAAQPFMALVMSFGFHLLAALIIIVGLPLLTAGEKAQWPEVIPVQLLGELGPPASETLPVEPVPEKSVAAEPSRPDQKPVSQPPPVPSDLAVDETPFMPINTEPGQEPSEVVKTGAKAQVDPPPVITKQVFIDPLPPTRSELDREKERAAEEEAQIAELMKGLEVSLAQKDSPVDNPVPGLGAPSTERPGGADGQGGGSTKGLEVDPEKARYYAHIRDIVKYNWITPPGVISDELLAIYRVTVQPDGSISSLTLERSSGNHDYDLSVERAIRLSSPLPSLPPVFGGEPTSIGFRFSPQDLR